MFFSWLRFVILAALLAVLVQATGPGSSSGSGKPAINIHRSRPSKKPSLATIESGIPHEPSQRSEQVREIREAIEAIQKDYWQMRTGLDAYHKRGHDMASVPKKVETAARELEKIHKDAMKVVAESRIAQHSKDPKSVQNFITAHKDEVAAWRNKAAFLEYQVRDDLHQHFNKPSFQIVPRD